MNPNAQIYLKKIKIEDIIICDKKEESELDMLQNTNKTMSYMMPIMAFSISLVAPLGLALYWLMSNILMILERVFLNIVMSKKEMEEEA